MSAASHSGRFVSVSTEGGVANVVWSRPERRNAIGREVAEELTIALNALAGRAEIVVVVLRSASAPFCSGWDVNDFKVLDATTDPASFESFFVPGRELLSSISAMPQITIAAAAGMVLGFGCSLLARCDFAVAADDAEFSLPEIRRGMPPATVLPELLSVMSRRAALEWAVSGDKFNAARALADGLITSVAPRESHAAEVDALAKRIAGWGPELVRETKALTSRLADAPPSERVRIGVGSAVERMRCNAAVSAAGKTSHGG